MATSAPGRPSPALPAAGDVPELGDVAEALDVAHTTLPAVEAIRPAEVLAHGQAAGERHGALSTG